ncbi:MAG: PDZ domain-containing protein, partial [Acidimicrobiales bacterium]
MSAPKVTAVAEASPAARAGLRVGDELLSLNGRRPRDVIEYHALVDDEALDVRVRRSAGCGEGVEE